MEIWSLLGFMELKIQLKVLFAPEKAKLFLIVLEVLL